MKHLLIALTLILGFSSFSSKRFMAPDYKFHSVYIYNFTKYIQWPNAGQDIQISILGNQQEAVNAFKAMAEAKSGSGKQFTVKVLTSTNEVSTCDILFIPGKFSNMAADAINKLAGQNTLIITEKEGMIAEGSGINFILVENKLKFELSKSNLDKAGLKVSSQLIQMAILK
ncbi:MAG: YfiR family protein [Cyclobacteriaceae bacterium]